jgi:hypothetical protein
LVANTENNKDQPTTIEMQLKLSELFLSRSPLCVLGDVSSASDFLSWNIDIHQAPM